LLVHKDVEDNFVQLLKNVVIEFFGKDPQKSPDYSRIINERHTNRLVQIIKATDSKKIILGGNYDIKDRFIAPTIIRDVKPDDEVMKEEVKFFKSLIVNRYLVHYYPLSK
jgi:aldehyde dehydrogenase (NAD+)